MNRPKLLQFSLSMFIALILASSLSISQIAVDVSILNTGLINYNPNIKIGTYWDANCENKVSYINWGLLEPGSNKKISLYLRNEGEVPVMLKIKTINWHPSNVTDYINLISEYVNNIIEVNETVSVSFGINVSIDIFEIKNFYFEIELIGNLEIFSGKSVIPSLGALPGIRYLTIMPTSIGGNITAITGVNQPGYGCYSFEYGKTIYVTTEPELITPPGILPQFFGWSIEPKPLWWTEENPDPLSKTVKIITDADYTISPLYQIPTPNGTFKYRIADFMVDIISPNIDDRQYANLWQACLDDLKTASPSNEITHIQLRTFWRIPKLDDSSTWEYPEIGAYDGPNGGQQLMCNNWKKWIFGDPMPTYGPPIAKRIHDAGFKVEFCLATAWTNYGTISDALPVFKRYAKESDYNFSGEKFLQNYMDNCLRPIAQFLAQNDNFGDGDIFMIAFEIGYSPCDFMWSHNEKWISIIQEIRQIFINAGKSGVLLTADLNGWINDIELGSELTNFKNYPGISGATYLKYLDFISFSFWCPPLTIEQMPDETPVPLGSIRYKVAKGWYENMNFYKRGTGYNIFPGVYGRNFMQDFYDLYHLMGKPIVINVGWENRHLYVTSAPRRITNIRDNQEQAEAWAGLLMAFQPQEWCAGIDFERYADPPELGRLCTSWRRMPAEKEIINGIKRILSLK
ncbi:MAG: hypothetical protein QW674_05515 [Candidatus Bathyarchaeia archaeon]